ncbi:MAG: glycosyltransferase family 4 protein [Thermoplasmata archaeon]|nr:MAG: glycosyltransferase family 4 protein [Thermoplasmata archaeon]
MKILKLCVRFSPAPGGVESQQMRVAKELIRQGHDVEVFCSDLYTEIPWKRLDEPYSNVEGIPVRRFKAYSLPGDMQYSIMPSMVGAVLKERWDIIHAHSWGFYPSHVGAIAKRAKRGKFVLTPHLHPGETSWGGERRKRARGIYDKYLSKRVTSAASRVICVSQGEMKYAVEAGISPNKIVIVPDSVDVSRFDGLAEGIFKKKYGIHYDFVLFVGRLAKNKGLEYLVGAMPDILNDFPNTKLVLIGEDEGMHNKLIGHAKELGIEHNILFLGMLDDNEVSEAFLDCSVFVLPSEFEAFGIVLIEAMAAGKPTVATRVGGVPYVVEEGKTTTLVDYADSNQLAVAICDLLLNEKKRISFGRSGRKLVENNFTIEKVVNRLQKVYLEVLKDS